MTENPILIETSFADAIAIIAAASELPEQTRKHWPSSMRQIAKALDKPMEVIPARYSAVRADLLGLHHVPAGLTAKTMQNHKSNTKSALLWLAREKAVPEHGAPLTVEWEARRVAVKDGVARSRLSSFMRYCSANDISPAEVDDVAVDRFVGYRARCGKPADDAFRRLLARAWNANVAITGWPTQRLVEPPVKAAVEIEWEAFPEGLRRDVDRYLQGLTRIRKSRTGQRIRPLKELHDSNPARRVASRSPHGSQDRGANCQARTHCQRCWHLTSPKKSWTPIGRRMEKTQSSSRSTWHAGSWRSRKKPNASTMKNVNVSTKCGGTWRITAKRA